MPLYSAGLGGQGQLANITNFMDQQLPAQRTIYSEDNARNLAKMMIGSVGMMPQTKINERFESLDAQLSGLSGQILTMDPKFKIALYNTLEQMPGNMANRRPYFENLKNELRDDIIAKDLDNKDADLKDFADANAPIGWGMLPGYVP